MLARAAPIPAPAHRPARAERGPSHGWSLGMTRPGGHSSLQEAGVPTQPGPQASAAQPTGQGVEVSEAECGRSGCSAVWVVVDADGSRKAHLQTGPNSRRC